MQIVRIGLDLAKYVFEVHGVDCHGKVVVRKTLRRDAVASFFANLPRCLVGMEASNGAHYWARVLSDLGHEVRLISPQFVTPYVKSNKNDRNDAEAICEAVGRPSMRFVPPKSTDQLAIQAVHRIRRRLVADRVRLVNQIRGLLSEHGMVIARDISQLRRGLAVIVGNDDDGLSDMVRSLMRELRAEMAELDDRIATYDRRIREIFRTSEQCQRLGKIEGIGPVTATALIAAVGNRTCFKNGRQFAAWLGLVPKQRSSGGRARLFGISKRGDRYLRTLMIHGARAALGKAAGKQDPRSLWLNKLRQRRHPNVAAVALANKNARIVWAMLSGSTFYEPAPSVKAA
ncbi:IS110 family transposase [Mesorhizobium amorphae]|uniref:Transposase IS116/IS110/IS902 n=1 Tax=Mesorhizobium amorphae CCNWGS0123 TaxID=1082933 RepID=G6YJ55_9HYPH|nr:IS110 family transposase [Mesorhizobium amorphae]ANT54716.1 transposase [Mesorhizobium amorphae CCNWGS0123]EHH05483.1 transposase IS116/IS110/IS902 [Mesorhizobium amorphae CCNWGS0123]